MEHGFFRVENDAGSFDVYVLSEAICRQVASDDDLNEPYTIVLDPQLGYVPDTIGDMPLAAFTNRHLKGAGEAFKVEVKTLDSIADLDADYALRLRCEVGATLLGNVARFRAKGYPTYLFCEDFTLNDFQEDGDKTFLTLPAPWLVRTLPAWLQGKSASDFDAAIKVDPINRNYTVSLRRKLNEKSLSRSELFSEESPIVFFCKETLPIAGS